MKAILVMDMPECCNQCRFYETQYYNKEKTYIKNTCWAYLTPSGNHAGDHGIDLELEEVKQSCCPLKPLPQKKGKYGELNHYDTDIHYEIGWNDCIDEILGGK